MTHSSHIAARVLRAVRPLAAIAAVVFAAVLIAAQTHDKRQLASAATMETQSAQPASGCERGCITEYALPEGSRPFQAVAGPDGALWLTMKGGRCDPGTGNRIGRLTIEGEFNEYVVPTEKGYPSAITNGPDGALWFGIQFGNKIGRITTDGVITEYPVPTGGTFRDPSGCSYETSSPAEGAIITGPDGNLWFTEAIGNKIGRITPAGRIAEFLVPTPNSGPLGMTVGPDGALWFIERLASTIGRITVNGDITEYPLPNANSFPNVIVSGPDGALWFSELMTSQMGRITTDGIITEFPTPDLGPVGVVVGPDQALWLAGYTGNEIARMTLDGVLTHRYPIPTPKSGALLIDVGPDGNLWFTMTDAAKIGRLQIQPPLPTGLSQR